MNLNVNCRVCQRQIVAFRALSRANLNTDLGRCTRKVPCRALRCRFRVDLCQGTLKVGSEDRLERQKIDLNGKRTFLRYGIAGPPSRNQMMLEQKMLIGAAS